MENKTFTLQEICKAISDDLKSRRITQKTAAEMIGTTKQTIANQLSGKKRFSVNMAQKFNEHFGYNIEFLLFGKEPFYAPGRFVWHPREGTFDALMGNADDPVMQHSRLMGRVNNILHIMNDQVAIECFNTAVSGNYEESDRLREILVDRYAWDVPRLCSDPKRTEYFRKQREFFCKVEIASAKELVKIQEKAACGEIIDVDAEVERFKKRVIWIKDSFKDDAKKNHPEYDFTDYVTEEEQRLKDTLFQCLKNNEENK